MIILGSKQYRAMQQGLTDLHTEVQQLRALIASYRSPSKPVRMKIVEIDYDWILCKHLDGENEGEELYVAKQPHLRKTGNETGYTYTDGQNREHDSSEELQEIFPAYVVDEELTAALQIGGTGVEDPDENPIVFLELTARNWTYECEE